MTNETRKRIEAYKKALPEMQERVMAVAILLVMSVSMMISASFAWLTISRHPEVTGVNTSVAANGNLEIALATGEANTAKVPGESNVGDSSAAKAQSVVSANITWGNLVNLSDPSYGLDNLTLRPAQLNQSSLLVSPLYGAVYKGDGRVEKLNSSFAYSTWDSKNQLFMVSDKIGVRAISSTTVEAVGFAQQVYEKRGDAETANFAAGNAYTTITTTKSWMDSLAGVMGTFMTAKMNAGQGDESLTNPTIENKDVKNLAALFGAFVDVYELQFEAMAKLANYQLFLLNNSESGTTAYNEKTAADIKATTEAKLKAEKIQISGLDQALKDYPKLVDGYTKLSGLSEGGSVKWEDSGLNAIVNSLMDVGICTLDGTKINNIGVSNATGYLDGKTHNAVITNGVLFNFEKMNGTRCNVENLSVSAKVKRMGMTIPATISANITTDAPVPSQFYTDLVYADSLNQGAKGVEVAQDTYGLAVDLWVRTNAAGSYLTLEGNVLTKSEMVRDTGTDANGNEVELFTLTRSSQEEVGDGTTQTVNYDLTLYKVVTKEGNTEVTTWYNASNHSTVELENGESPNPKMKELITVIGFEGENRVWEDANAWESNSQLSLDATTQGSGSCYVYYADSPEDQARSLKLLQAMNVAFIDDQGKLLATAIMDTERFYAENGRVTVPLVLRSDSLEIEDSASNETVYAITPLVQNEPKRITAIVYLDGTKLTNQDVLAASDIQGKMNIQFGSSVTLSHAKDEALMNATRSVSASVSNSNFKYDESLETGTPMKTTVTVKVAGDEPTAVTAFFIRAISSSQGSREEKMNFEQQADGSWIADYTFTDPGNYILRSVELDGQTYDLATCPTVTVDGFSINSLECIQAENRHVSVMTAAGTSTVDLKLRFASDKVEAMPTTVQGRFLRKGDGTAVNINFSYNAGGVWTGQATFISSGEYTLEYLLLNGEYTQLDESLIQTATIYLGMKTAVYTESPINILYIPNELADNEKNLAMKVKIMDNTGKEMEGLQNARLYYAMEGSSINGFDTQLTWDASSRYYVGTFKSDVGIYKFSKVTVGNNTITYAVDAPRFTIMSPNPPSYEGFTPNAYVYQQGGGITMDVQLKDSSTATVAALIRNQKDGRVHEVQGSLAKNEGGIQTWSFLIPTTSDGKQDGNWQLDTVEIWNYYDEDGNFIYAETDATGKLTEQTDENRDTPMEFHPKDHITKAVTTVYVTVNKIADNALGKDGNTVTGKFMDTYTISGLSVRIEDFEKQEIQNLNKVTLNYAYGNNSAAYGGYTSADDTLNNAKADFAVTFTKNGTTYTQAEDVTVKYAGTYTPELKYFVTGGNPAGYSVNAEDIAFAIHSVTPKLSIDSISPKGSHKTVNSSDATTTVTSKIEGNTITIYPNSEVTGSGCNKKGVLHEEPKVTLKLTGLGQADSATLTFTEENNGTVRMYSGTNSKNGTQTNAYVWDKNTGETVMRFVGYNDAGSCDDSEPAGKLISGSTVTLVQGTDSYTVAVDVITIINKKP